MSKQRKANYKWIKEIYCEIDGIKEQLNGLKIIVSAGATNPLLVPPRLPQEKLEDWIKRCVKIINLEWASDCCPRHGKQKDPDCNLCKVDWTQ